MTTEILFQTSIDSKNKSANTSFSSEEGISAISEKMQNKCKINNISSDNDELDTNARNKGSLMSASSSEMIDKSAELSDQKVGAVSSSSFEESSDSEDKKSTTSGASSDLSSDNNKTAEIRVVGGVEFGTPWMESSSNQTSSGNEDENLSSPPNFNHHMVSRGVNRSDSAVSKSSGKSIKSINSVISQKYQKSIDSNISSSPSSSSPSSSINYAVPEKISTPRDSLLSNSNSAIVQLVPEIDTTTELLLYNEYPQILRQLRRRREDDMKRARRTLEESQWLLDLLWKATNVHKKFSRHNSITSELETVQEELQQARQVFLGRQKVKSIERKSSFSKRGNGSNNFSKRNVNFDRKIIVSSPQPETTALPTDKPEIKNLESKSAWKTPRPASRPPSFSTTSLDTKYKASGGLKNAPERTKLIGKIIETAVKIDEKEARLNNTPRRLANNDRLIIKLKIMLSKKWSKDGEPITWTKIDDGATYDV